MNNNEGALTEAIYYILLALQYLNHGYGVMQDIEKMTKGRLILAPGTLYGALNNLSKKKWIESLPEDKNSRKKEYIITQLGKMKLENELKRLKELLNNGENILVGGQND
ncbi:MAG: PadR family transcriptional regulator [Peptoniphilaceae bacterium]